MTIETRCPNCDKNHNCPDRERLEHEVKLAEDMDRKIKYSSFMYANITIKCKGFHQSSISSF